MMDFLLITGGLILLCLGAESLLRGSLSIARNFGLSKLLVGTVIVGFGTSLPELGVSVEAVLKGSSDIALGNVVGSNIANILFILSLGVLLYPVLVQSHAVKRDAAVMVISSLALCFIVLSGEIRFLAGLGLLCGLFTYVFLIYRADQKLQTPDSVTLPSKADDILKPAKAILYSVIGLALLITGAKLMVEGAISVARNLGISEVVIGLTIVAVGTSLPELATSIMAAIKKQGEVIIGNVIGSNIFNILGILGITAMVKPIIVAPQIASFDVWIMLAAALFLSILLWSNKKIGCIAGSFMIFGYIAYIAWLFWEQLPKI
jgi:cation:H+ antiporter